MFEYGFEEGLDFMPILAKSTGGRPSKDFILTLDTAKEISMLQRTEKGKEARQYFIACEKRMKNAITLSPLEILKQQVSIMESQEKRLSAVETTIHVIESKINNIDTEYFSLVGWYRYCDQVFDLTKVQSQQKGKTLTRISKQLGYSVKRVHNERYGYINTYHSDMLEKVTGFGVVQ